MGTRPTLLVPALAVLGSLLLGPAASFGLPPQPAAHSAAAPAAAAAAARAAPAAAAALDRRGLFQRQSAASLASAALLLLGPTTTAPQPAAAAGHQIDYSTFKKSLFNTPPGVLQFPPWMEGQWEATFTFVGADFPSSSSASAGNGGGGGGRPIPKDQIVADIALPGFKRLSIAMVPDVGKAHTFPMRFVAREDEGAARVEEDRAFNLKAAIESEVGRGAVASIDYNAGRNPNRLTINLLPQATVNAQKIELFGNARAALPPQAGEEALESFRFFEDLRQVSITPRLAETSTVGDYRHVWELYRQPDGSVKGFLSTVAYATPQDPLFQLGAFAPLVVYFHTLTMRRQQPTGEK